MRHAQHLPKVLSFLQQVSHHFHRSIEHHARPHPSHDKAHLLPLFFSVAMRGTEFARRLLVLPTTMAKLCLTILYQRCMLSVRLLLLQLMTTIQAYHQSDDALFSFYDFTHEFISFSNCLQ